MNMNTIKQELHKKIARMDRDSFNKFISDLENCYIKTHGPDKRWQKNKYISWFTY